MESKIKRILAILLLICFLVSLTVTAVSAGAAVVSHNGFANEGALNVAVDLSDEGQGTEHKGVEDGGFGPAHAYSKDALYPTFIFICAG